MKKDIQFLLKFSFLILVLTGLLFFAKPFVGVVRADTLDPATCTLVDTTRTCDLYASSGTITLPGSVDPITIWGYSFDPTGVPTLPGPAIIANQGEHLVVNLHNNLPDTTGLYFQGQSTPPDMTGVLAGESITYEFDLTNPGTFLYEAALLPNSQYQVAMGLFGGLIVRPTGQPLQAYDPDSAFNDEALLILSEIDPALNNSLDPTTFDMRNFAPKFFLINGAVYPETTEIPSLPNNKLLLRIINAGLIDHTLSLLGLDQTIIAMDGYPMTHSRELVSWTVAPGQTADTLVDMPTSTPPGGGNYALFDSSLLLHNNNAPGYGGMLTYITLVDGVTPAAGPTTSSVTVSPNPTDGTAAVTLSADIPGATSAEYFIDAIGTDGSGISMTQSGGLWTATFSPTDLQNAGLTNGDYTFYVHGFDGSAWGGLNFVIFHLDKTGPITKAITLSPNPSNGSVSVNISGTGTDISTGYSNVVSAEFLIDDLTGTSTAMTVVPIGPIVGLSGTIPQATMATLTEGEHDLFIRSIDEWGNIGAETTIPLKVDQTGPEVSSVTTTPTLLWDRVPVRINVTVEDLASGTPAINSNVMNAEAFIDTVGPVGTGIPLIPRDGLFNEPSESAYADITLATINALDAGAHFLHVRGQDESGNWGTVSSTLLIIMPQGIFANGFETGDFTNWSANTGNVSVTTQAASDGNFGMEAALAGDTPGFVTDASPGLLADYFTLFNFNPNDAQFGDPGNIIELLAGLNDLDANVFALEMTQTIGVAASDDTRATADYQVRLAVETAEGTQYSDWFAISADWHTIEIEWHSEEFGYVKIFVDGALVQTVKNLDTRDFLLDAVLLGPSGGQLGVTSSGTMYFDNFGSSTMPFILQLGNSYFMPLIIIQ